MTIVTRRNVLKGGTTLVGGMAGILAAGRAPAYAQSTTVHWLRWTDFVPASDQLLRNEIAKECEKALGIKLNIETINANDIQARVTSAIQSGSGPDVVCVLNNWGQLYGESVIDVSDIAEVLGKSQGGFYDTSRAVAYDGKKWIAVPWCIVGLQIAYRKSWFAEIGYTDGKFPQLFEEPGCGEEIPWLDSLQGRLRQVVRLPEGLLGRPDHGLGKAQAVGRRPDHASLQASGAHRALRRLRRALYAQGSRGRNQVHHH